jgi:formylglycine-generating enzyme required for sulfatase activity
VSNAQYGLCVADGDCVASSYADDSDFNAGDQPVVGVSWFDAGDYCAWAGSRLPTEAEWEYAARGPEGFRYPWGNTFDGDLVNYCDNNCQYDWRDDLNDDGYALTAPVGSYSPAGDSWVDAADMAGNVWEWVQDWYGSGYYGQSVAENPMGPENGGTRVLRGGSWVSGAPVVRAAYRGDAYPDGRNDVISFRCVVVAGM